MQPNDTEEPYAWYTIERDEKNCYLYFNNKSGIHRQELKFDIKNLSALEQIKDKREAARARINRDLSAALRKAEQLAKDDPEEFKRRMNSR